MAQITAITLGKHGTDEFAIKVDGRITSRLGATEVQNLGLRVGLEWDDRLASRVEKAAEFHSALHTAMSKLNRRAMTRRRLDSKLRALRIDEAVRHRVLNRLKELGLLDDESIGRQVIQQNSTAGPGLLRQKLRHVGLDAELTDRLLDESIDAQVQIKRATVLVRQRLERMAGLDRATQRRRLYGLLARRGFDQDTINQVFQSVTDDFVA